MATHNDETPFIALILMLVPILIAGYMDDQDAQILEHPVQVAQK